MKSAPKERGTRVLLVALVYLLFAMPASVHAGISFCGMQGAIFAEVSVLGCALRVDARLMREGAGWTIKPAYGGSGRLFLKRKRQNGRAGRIWPYLASVLRVGKDKRLRVHMRIGLDDAGGTAVAAGAVRAVASALLMHMQIPGSLRIEPDFSAPCLVLAADCIFCVSPGDIVFAVIKTAAERRGKRAQNGKASH